MTSRKKKFAFEVMLKELHWMQALETPATISQIQAKIASLQNAHQCAYAVEEKMGAGSSGFQYMKIMTELFGTPTKNVPISSVLMSSSSSVSVSSEVSSFAMSSSVKSAAVANDLTWTEGQVRALLDCYGNRQEELNHATKKKFFYNNVCQDLLSMGVFNRPVNASSLQTKMGALLTAYKAARDTETRTGRGATKFKYMSEMEEIFGSRPIISNTHTANLYGKEIAPLPVRSQVLGDTVNDEEVLILNDRIDYNKGIYFF